MHWHFNFVVEQTLDKVAAIGDSTSLYTCPCKPANRFHCRDTTMTFPPDLPRNALSSK